MCFCMAFTALLYMSDGRNVRTKVNQAMTLGWTSRMKTDGWHSLKQVRCNPDVAPHLSCGRVACFWSAMSKHVQTKIGRFKFDKNDWKKNKKISTKHGFQDMDLPRNIRLNPMNSFHVQHGFSPSKSDVKEIFLTPWDVGHRHLKRTALGTPGLSEIPRLHDYHPEAKPEDFRRDFWNDPPFRSYQLYGDYIIMVIYGI
jgi:hypothetical protein